MSISSKAVYAMPFSCRRSIDTVATDAYIAELEELARDLAFENAFTGSHRCCAERRLLQTYVQQARKQGVPPQKLVAWVRRKLGGGIVVWRYTADGGIGRAAPCLFCSRELQRFDLLVDCSLGGGQWFHGRLSEPGAPTPQLTGGQQKVLRAQGWALCVDPKQPARGDAEQRPQGVTKKQEREWQQRGKGKGHAR